MPSTYTSNLGIELPADGELDGVWGDVVNENMDILDRAINGVLSLSLSGTTSTLTTSDGALSDGQYKLLLLTGSPSGTHTITLSPNDAQKIYFVRNTTAQSVIFTQGSGGNVTIATGDSGIIYANGAGAGAAIANLTDHFAMSSVNITGGSITGLSDLGLSSTGPFLLFAETDTTDTDARVRLGSGDLIFSTVTDANVEVRENMRIESGGNVGIGTSDPFAHLEVSDTTNPTAAFIAYISGTTMTVTGITSGALAVGDRVFGAGVEWNTVITAQLTGTTGASGTYSVSNSQTVSSNPGIAMDSFNAGKSTLRLTNTDTTEGTNQTTGAVEFYGSDATAGAGVKGYVAVIAEDSSPSSAMLFGTSGDTGSAVAVERMRIDSSGNVGIGTKSPAAKLDISVNSSGDALRITQIGAGNALVVEDSANPDSTPFVVTSDGNVGIGISTPTVKLAIRDDGAQAIVYRADNTRYAALGDTGATDDGGVLLYDAAGALQSVIRAQSNSYVQGGNFGIGKSNPSVALDVVGAITATGNLTLTSTGPALVFQETDTTNQDGRIRISLGDMLFETIQDDGTQVRENMRIESNGNVDIDGTTFSVDAVNNRVGIGTTSPAAALDVVGGITATTALSITGADSTATQVILQSFRDGVGSQTGGAVRIRSIGDGTGDAVQMVFDTNSTERMRIDSAGTVFFCGSTTSGVFDGDGVNINSGGETTVNVTSGCPLDLNQSTNDSAARSMIRFFRREIQNGSITTSSTATAYVTSSDYRLKENVQQMTGALDLVAQLNPVTYTWKTDGSDGQGFIAHELQAVVPDCVIGEKDAVDADGKPEYQGVDTSFLVATLTAAIQEQQAMITALEARLTALETQ